mmetsp:Transcript_53569/g.107572  ORF Transcript_53569/g.107572 Transcript_53569/m.107572 type:complete len:284 (+) Transcript_53569:46-897(+)
MPSARSIILALALLAGAEAAASAPSVSMNLAHEKLSGGLKADSMKGTFKVESQVSDDMSVGVDLDNSDSPLKRVFGNFKSKFGTGDVEADMTMDMGDNSISGDVTYSEADNSLVARVNSATGVESVKYSRAGKGWSFNPTFNIQDKSIDLEASADYSDDTNINVKINAAGESALEVNHRLDADTSMNIQGNGADFNSMNVELTRQIDGDNTVKPKFDLASKHVTLSWVRKIDAGRTVTMNVDPDNSVGFDVEGASDEDWKASINAPWGDFKDVDVSVGRKFNF